jgi:hypothetical protein
MTMKQKAERAVGDVTGGVNKVLKQCVKFMTQARISRAMQRLEAQAVCAGTTQVADELEPVYALGIDRHMPDDTPCHRLDDVCTYDYKYRSVFRGIAAASSVRPNDISLRSFSTAAMQFQAKGCAHKARTMRRPLPPDLISHDDIFWSCGYWPTQSNRPDNGDASFKSSP